MKPCLCKIENACEKKVANESNINQDSRTRKHRVIRKQRNLFALLDLLLTLIKSCSALRVKQDFVTWAEI